MADPWLRWRKSKKDGRRWASIIYGSPKRALALHTTDPVLARAKFRRWLEAHGDAPATACSLEPTKALEAFLARVAEGATPETVRCYRSPLQQIVKAWEGMDPTRWNPVAFRAYVAAHPKWKPRTVQLLRSASLRFLKWARAEGWPVGEFVGTFRGPKIVTRPYEFLGSSELAALLGRAEGVGEVAVGLAALAGLRMGEVQRAEWSDVRWKARTLHVRARKAHHERTVPISPALLAVLERHKGEGAMVPDLNSDLMRPLLRRWSKAAGLAVRPTLRTLRHTFATRLVAEGVDLATVQYLMGHRSAAMTLRYAHHDDARARAAVGKVLS
jgi:integrase